MEKFVQRGEGSCGQLYGRTAKDSGNSCEGQERSCLQGTDGLIQGVPYVSASETMKQLKIGRGSLS